MTPPPTDGPPPTVGPDPPEAVAFEPSPSPVAIPGDAVPDAEGASSTDGDGHHDRSVEGLANYVYGTISTLVAIGGLTFETHPRALTTAGVVVAGAVAIWLAHGVSQLVVLPSWQNLQLRSHDVRRVLQGSWTIVTAAIPATVIFILAGVGLWTVRTAFVLAEIVGVLALAVVGFGTAGGRGGPVRRRLLYIGMLVLVGVLIVLLDLAVHLF